MLKKLTLAVGLLITTACQVSHGALIINEVFAGGGGATGTFNRDYIELYNTDLTPLDLSGWRVAYASAANAFTNPVVTFGPGSFIGANDYVLLVTGSAGVGPPAIANANFFATPGASLSNTAGSVTVFNALNAQIDTVGWGVTVTGFDAGGLIKVEGGVLLPATPQPNAAPAPSSTSSALTRTLFADTNINVNDFSNAIPSPTVGTNSLVTAVPEPTSMALLCVTGVVGLAVRYRRKKVASQTV